jgi:hypothetical protein
VTVRQSNGEVGARAGVVERVELVPVEPGGAVAQRGIVLEPGFNEIVVIDA